MNELKPAMSIRLEPQDAVLERLGMWPLQFRGMTIKQVPKEQRGPIYEARRRLSLMINPVLLPGEEDRKYDVVDVDALIRRSKAA